MEKIIEGKVFVLGDNIDTDQIIPACHLVYSLKDPTERKLYGKYALSGLPRDKYPEPFSTDEGVSPYAIIIAGKNFGSGSSREQAPACLGVAGVKVVIAASFARIFYRNSVNGGFLIPIELQDGHGTAAFQTGDVASIDMENWTLGKHGDELHTALLRDFGEVGPIVEAGGIFKVSEQRDFRI
uniref:3-isopropylmalate dehydratase n=1 Tax=Candidatus Kentrum eta TaxID=2126337 RepID=A0A450V5I5_9GAMM|nr:MAG: 3-isopropylmalate dehydratase, small subunit [Candidatus Kentron sp. H]VFK00898.1 MAG: 3-isopropylmalate dehydratase, small subunit [Candidatus Kentron sp. H]VFK04774.1 MAG: 3-isopropylmalate dehydratase, small subunit [Candidatus Kentron sp. H]